MIELKQLSEEAIPAALEKAMRYRLLNEPTEAESICLDVLSIDPDHQEALVIQLLALTDRFAGDQPGGGRQAEEILPRLRDAYERAYYAGIIRERQAKARLQSAHPGARHDVYEFLTEAMSWFEKAEKLRPPKNDDAILRWNTCARLIKRHSLAPRSPEPLEILGE